ncbi:MAG: uncharacterized protein QOH03_2780 [Kribbellaceae bacterium]|nr:uncharacterized protein [Kribbellaceae bacterium]
MPYYVHGEDQPDVQDGLVEHSEAHWSYMDRYADKLILRGPTLSGDGEEHTGSVHVVDVDDRAAAERFAYEEPFWSAGYYQPLTVVRAVVLLDRTGDSPRSLMTAEWAPVPLIDSPASLAEGLAELSFLAVLVDDAGAASVGLVAALTVVPAEAAELVRPIADRLNGLAAMKVTARRWQRGGRSQSDS